VGLSRRRELSGIRVKKGIYLQAKIYTGGGKDAASTSSLLEKLPAAFAKANPGMRLTVKKHSPPDHEGKVSVEVYIQGEQAPASSFLKLASRALNKTVAALSKGSGKSAAASTKAAAKISVGEISEIENGDENEDVILPPASNP
jgi:hypothetical protein